MTETNRPRSAEETTLLERARRRLPGGVLGTSRYADEAAFVVKRGQGSKIYDVSGREYIDYVLASGPLVLGHAHPAVVAAVRSQIEGGSTYFMVNEPIIELAEEICKAVPCAEQVRFASTGSEATFFALRVARTARGRDKILKFEGGYHGAHDYSMMSATPRSPKAFPAPVPDSSGIPHALEAEVLVAPYNDLAAVEKGSSRRTPRSSRPSSSNRSSGSSRRSRGFSPGSARSRDGTAFCSCSTRSSPAFASPTVAPSSTTASFPTSRAWARSSGEASRSPRFAPPRS
jgi:Aminotransferase class-III